MLYRFASARCSGVCSVGWSTAVVSDRFEKSLPDVMEYGLWRVNRMGDNGGCHLVSRRSAEWKNRPRYERVIDGSYFRRVFFFKAFAGKLAAGFEAAFFLLVEVARCGVESDRADSRILYRML